MSHPELVIDGDTLRVILALIEHATQRVDLIAFSFSIPVR